jgi:hypothetical protein
MLLRALSDLRIPNRVDIMLVLPFQAATNIARLLLRD